MYRKGASGNYHVSATKLLEHLTIIYNQHLWSHPRKISHVAGKIEKCWQELSVGSALCAFQSLVGGLRPRLCFASVSLVGRVPFCGELRIGVWFWGELETSISAPSSHLETASQWALSLPARRKGGLLKFLAGQGAFLLGLVIADVLWPHVTVVLRALQGDVAWTSGSSLWGAIGWTSPLNSWSGTLNMS